MQLIAGILQFAIWIAGILQFAIQIAIQAIELQLIALIAIQII